MWLTPWLPAAHVYRKSEDWDWLKEISHNWGNHEWQSGAAKESDKDVTAVASDSGLPLCEGGTICLQIMLKALGECLQRFLYLWLSYDWYEGSDMKDLASASGLLYVMSARKEGGHQMSTDQALSYLCFMVVDVWLIYKGCDKDAGVGNRLFYSTIIFYAWSLQGRGKLLCLVFSPHKRYAVTEFGLHL